MTNFGSKKTKIDVWFDKGLAEDLVIKAGMKGLKKWGHTVLGASKEIVPLDTGTLQRSGRVNLNEKMKKVTVSYNTPYARRQHEEHKTKSKYLEKPFNEMTCELENFVGGEISEVLINAKYSDKAVFNKKFPNHN